MPWIGINLAEILVWPSSGAWHKTPPCLIPLAALIPQNPQQFHAVTVAERVHVDGWWRETNATHASERPYTLDWMPVCRECQSTEKGNPSSARQTLEEQIPNR